MLEWLSGDPLNGAIITIAFFISVIIGKYIRMKRTASGIKGKSIDQRIKLFYSILSYHFHYTDGSLVHTHWNFNRLHPYFNKNQKYFGIIAEN